MLLACFATTVRGLEELLATELKELGAEEIRIVNAGMEFNASLSNIMAMNLNSRLASRIMIRLGYSGYRHEDDIYRLARKIDWLDWFHSGNSIKVATSAIQSPLKSLDFVTLKVKDAICDYFNEKVDSRPDVNKVEPDMRIYNFLTKDTVTIYLDTSGDTLFKRGYRRLKLEAPIRENLASGLIQLSGWQPDQAFYDPMCGSGTLAVEAIGIGLNLAPGLNRNFAFEKLANFDSDNYQRIQALAKKKENRERKLKIYASDINRKAIEIARQNFQQIKLEEYVEFSYGDFLSKKAPAESGVLLTNPPYGVRLEELDRLTELYPQIGNKLKQNFANWNCYFFTADLRMPKLVRLKPSRKIPVYNGALECRLYEFKMVSGSNR
ncbi:THUMP domain-containing class I SAM-dependent RNA methyltransferase [Aquella oligotrophica]|uniref:RNA methyltransferase n=1 Tax=Aquella oligotrophica TaxID=2067065 RepID=A0A2I7N4S6_9NEIS|nr:class I SAM-dependent RNA methyltransferase [Aquella oligotrophica]AUR51431.1 RNA methyltransferase [Aquella oligotrophica]